MAAAYLMNRTPHKTLKMETLFKMPHGEEADLSHLCVIRAKLLVDIKNSKTFGAVACVENVCGYCEKSKSYRVWNLKPRRVVESRNVTLLETPPPLLFPPLQLSPLKDLVPPSWDLDNDNLDNDHILYGDLFRNLRNHTGVLDFTASIPANHENASGVSADPQVRRLVDQIHDLIRRELLTPSAPSPGAVSPEERLPGAAGGPSSGGASPPSGQGASAKTGGLSPSPRAGYSKKKSRYAQKQDSSVYHRHATCCP